MPPSRAPRRTPCWSTCGTCAPDAGWPGGAWLDRTRFLPSLTSRAYAAPHGCRYESLTGTGTQLLATLDCGARDALSVVAVSPRTFTVTRTLIRLGTCLHGSISAALHDQPALLVETEGACLPPAVVPVERILKIRGAKATVVLSGSASVMPESAIW
jgi:hypothetical protein